MYSTTVTDGTANIDIRISGVGTHTLQAVYNGTTKYPSTISTIGTLSMYRTLMNRPLSFYNSEGITPPLNQDPGIFNTDTGDGPSFSNQGMTLNNAAVFWNAGTRTLNDFFDMDFQYKLGFRLSTLDNFTFGLFSNDYRENSLFTICFNENNPGQSMYLSLNGGSLDVLPLTDDNSPYIDSNMIINFDFVVQEGVLLFKVTSGPLTNLHKYEYTSNTMNFQDEILSNLDLESKLYFGIIHESNTDMYIHNLNYRNI